MDIQVVPFESCWYQQALALRDMVLRQPLGLTLGTQDIREESAQYHLVAVCAQRVVGCVVLKPLDAGTVQLRQMAVLPEMQRQGYGTALVQYAEVVAREHGFTAIILHARAVAVEFYRRLGYAVEGEQFIEVSIPHFMMRKAIANQ